jgi:cysteine desulfurase
MIYLDNLATTPCDPRVLEAMWPWFTQDFHNPHSTEHAGGRRAAEAVEAARAEIAALIGAEPSEIIFTSGATEANNLAIKGAARFAGAADRSRLITAATEHKCVLESVRDLAAEGFDPVILPVGRDGLVDPAALEAALATPTRLVSIMAANNETGVLQDIPALAAIAAARGALVHTDAAQAVGKVPVDARAWGVHLLSISGHKLYGPKGIGALFVRRRPRTRLAPLFSGGGQERGLRSGTVPTPLAVGLGEACRLARLELAADQARIAGLRDRLLTALRNAIPDAAENLTGPAPRLAGAVNLQFPSARATELITACPELAISTGSACSSAELAPSHVLIACGLSHTEAAASLRLSIGRFTSAADIDAAVRMLAAAYRGLRARLPHVAEA